MRYGKRNVNPLSIRIFCETYNVIFNLKSKMLNIIQFYKKLADRLVHVFLTITSPMRFEFEQWFVW